jgi:hypothetical protein
VIVQKLFLQAVFTEMDTSEQQHSNDVFELYLVRTLMPTEMIGALALH